MTLQLIAFTGAPRVGKSESAGYIARQHAGFTQHTFGRGIYEEVSKAFNVSIEQLGSDDWKRGTTDKLALINCIDPEFQRIIQEIETPDRPGVKRILDGCVLDKPRSSRFVLQRWATEYRRAQDPLYWIKQMSADMEAAGGSNKVVGDLREDREAQFLEEYATLHGYSILTIKIESWRNTKTEHSSDVGLSAQYVDATVQNNGELKELFAQIEVLIKGKLWHPHK